MYKLKKLKMCLKRQFCFCLSPTFLMTAAAFDRFPASECVAAQKDEWLRAGNHAEFPLWPTENLKNTSQPISETVIFRPGDLDDLGLNRAIKDTTVPTLTVYRPIRLSSRAPALVVCPGGGYGATVIDREGHAIARYFEKQGITVAVLKYRMPRQETFTEGLPSSQQDALEAVRFMRRHAAEWGFANNRVGIMGFSAGGHLAGSTAIFGDATDGSRPDFVAMLYPVVLLDGPYAHKGSRDNLIGRTPTPERIAKFSLERCIRTGLPPFFIAHAKDDKIVPIQNSVLLTDALRIADVPTELLLVGSGGHGFSLGRDPYSSQWKDKFLSWLDALP